MKNKIIIVVAVVFIVGFLILFKNSTTKQEVSIIDQVDQQTDVKQKLESKIDNQTSVTVTITPLNTASNSKEWTFNVVMSTHLVELDQDMLNIATLIDDSDKEYSPVRWEGALPGGHHREGVLVFDQIIPSPKLIKLRISNINNVVRNFVW